MKIYYRISDGGYNKVKPTNVNNKNCLANFCEVFHESIADIIVIADNVSDETYTMITEHVHKDNIHQVSIGHGAGTFNLSLNMALLESDDEIIYFVEDDYLHKKDSDKVLLEGFNLGSDFISLYDHPDKYMEEVNPYVEGGGEATRVFLSNTCHWKLTNSTTMTFASRVSTLRQYENTIRKHTATSHPYDFDMWIELRTHGASLITPLPGYSTHGEVAWLSPLTNWNLC